MKVSDLFTFQDFNNVDASFAYPLSGIYNKFLIEKNGIDNYLKLYEKYSGTFSKIQHLRIDKKDLPYVNEWNDFIEKYKSESINIYFPSEINNKDIIANDSTFKVIDNKTNYLFQIKDYLLISFKDKPKDYISSKFTEIFPNKKYNSEKYLITVTEHEISVYNLYTNNLIAKYAAGFSTEPKPVPIKNNLFTFSVSKKVFKNEFSNAVFSK